MGNEFGAKERDQGPKRMFWLRFFAMLCLLLHPAAFGLSAYAAKIYPSEGSAAAEFLEIGVGARAVGMAGAYTAVSDDPYAMYWNPAGLALLKDRNLAFTHNDYFSGLSQEYAVYSMPAPRVGILPAGSVRNGVMGVSLNYLNYGNALERRSGDYEGGNNLSPVEGKFGAYDLAFALGYGGSLGPGFRAGAELKFIRQNIDTKYGDSAALDLGALYDFDWHGRAFTAGFAVQNLGPGIKFVARRYPLPLTARAGLSTRLYGNSLLLSLDVFKPLDNYPSLAAGLEQRLGERLFLRTGYSCREYGNEAGGLSGFTLGLGFLSGPFSFDYAFSPFGALGNTQRFSAALRFAGPGPGKKERSGKVPAPAALLSVRTLEFRVEQKPLSVSRSGVTGMVRAEAVDAGIAAAQAGLISSAAVPAANLSSAAAAAVVPSTGEAGVVLSSAISSAAQEAGPPAVPPQIAGAQALSAGISEGVSLRALSFVTIMRGQEQATMAVTEGELPTAVLEKFPVASGPLRAWQLPALPPGLKGDIKLEFEAGKMQGSGGAVLYFFAGGVWKAGETKAVDCGERICRYSASVPYGQYYAVAVK